MAEDTRDPFDFDEDPLDGVDDLELPPSFEPPTPDYGQPPTSPTAGFGDIPTQSPPSSPPPTGFPPPGSVPPAQSVPPTVPPGYDSFGAPAVGASGVEPPEMPPSYGTTPPPGSYGASTPPPGSYGASMPPPAYGTGIPPQAPPQKKNRGCLFWGVIVLVIGLLLMGGCTAFVVFSGQSASDAANDFLSEVQAGDFEGASALTNSACNLSADRIEQDLAGLSQYFIIGVGPVASGSVTVDGQEFTILFELQDDKICSYTLDTVSS